MFERTGPFALPIPGSGLVGNTIKSFKFGHDWELHPKSGTFSMGSPAFFMIKTNILFLTPHIENLNHIFHAD